jgi:hypothetical protein
VHKRILPANPNLEQYKKIAKAFVKAWKGNVPVEIHWEGSLITITREHLIQKHPRLRGLPDIEAANANVSLADAQFLIAREYGFESWSRFANHIAAIRETREFDSASAESAEFIDIRQPIAISVAKAIREGEVEELTRLLEEYPDLAKARLRDSGPHDGARSLLHIATDWPGHFPRTAETIDALITAGAEVDAQFIGGAHRETPLHWAASSNDLEALNALLDAGANIEARGAVIADGTPIADAVAFAQWNAAFRLVELGAETTFAHEAALALTERVENRFLGNSPPKTEEIDQAFWFACHGGRRDVAEYLLKKGANPNWLPPWEKKTPLEAALRNGFGDLAGWLRNIGAEEADAIRV